jgi:ketosteroid isomerase-like protein
LDRLTDDVSWEQGLRVTDVPWFQRRNGKQQVAEFFDALAQGLALSVFEPQQVLAGEDDTVVAVIRVAGSAISTGKSFEEDLWVHLWKFDDAGKVTSFRHIGDLARQEIAFKG